MAIFLSKTGWDVQGQLVKAGAGESVFDAVSQRWPDMGHHARCGVLVQARRVEPDMQAGRRPYRFPGDGCQGSLVDIIDIEVDETVAGLVRSFLELHL